MNRGRQTHRCEGDIMGCCSEQAWPSSQAPLQAEQKTARQVVHGTAPGWPSVLGCRLQTAWHSSTGHQALLGSSFTPAGREDRDDPAGLSQMSTSLSAAYKICYNNPNMGPHEEPRGRSGPAPIVVHLLLIPQPRLWCSGSGCVVCSQEAVNQPALCTSPWSSLTTPLICSQSK